MTRVHGNRAGNSACTWESRRKRPHRCLCAWKSRREWPHRCSRAWKSRRFATFFRLCVVFRPVFGRSEKVEKERTALICGFPKRLFCEPSRAPSKRRKTVNLLQICLILMRRWPKMLALGVSAGEKSDFYINAILKSQVRGSQPFLRHQKIIPRTPKVSISVHIDAFFHASRLNRILKREVWEVISKQIHARQEQLLCEYHWHNVIPCILIKMPDPILQKVAVISPLIRDHLQHQSSCQAYSCSPMQFCLSWHSWFL